MSSLDERFETLLQNHLDESLTEYEQRELGELIRAHPRFAREFAFMTKMEILHRHMAQSGAASAKGDRPAVFRSWRVWAVIAACLAMLAGAYLFRVRETGEQESVSRKKTGTGLVVQHEDRDGGESNPPSSAKPGEEGKSRSAVAKNVTPPPGETEEPEETIAEAERRGEAGIVARFKGRATITGVDGKRRRASANDPVKMGDVLHTGRGSKLTVRFKDGTTIALGPRAKLTIDDFLYNPKDVKSRCETSLARGTFKVISGAIGKLAPDRVKIKTPTATIGIRGTACVGSTNGRKTLAIYTEGESISVSNDKGQTILTGQPGMGCETLAGQAPGPAKLYKLGQISRLTSLVTMQVIRTTTTHAPAGAPMHVPATSHGGCH